MDSADDSRNARPPQANAGMESSAPGSGPVEICAGCHQPLVRRGPKGECLRCLMDFMFSPEERPAEKSAHRYGHFEIVLGADGQPSELGAGAMATTYRALDTVLHTTVALKVINQTVAAHSNARARFLREARAAAKLHHLNVASVSHYGEQDGECYYAMELVEGETLEARVRREGPLPPALALDIGMQVARALAAAEACGVTHRDLKPSNIMLTTPQGERSSLGDAKVVKVIDWGLAKAVSAESPLGTDHTHGGFVGTPAFASPEQFSSSKDRLVDTRSDIYSLGVTLWYLLCGRTPFVGTTLEEIHTRQVDHPLPVEQLAAARLPGRIVALLKSMMAVNPSGRPQSSRELLEALRSCREHFPDVEAPRRLRRSARRRLIFAGGLMALLLAAFAVGAWWHSRENVRSPVDRSVAFLPLEDLAPDPADPLFIAGIQDKITSDLASIAGLKVIGRTSVREYKPGNRDLPAIGRALGVGHLLEGSVRRQAGMVHLNVRLVNVANGKQDWNGQYEADRAQIFDLETKVTRAVADALRAPPTAAETAAIDRPPTRNPEAYDLFLRAQTGTRLFANPEEQLHEIHRRIDLLERAVKLDPGFTRAYLRLATNYDTLTINRNSYPPEERSVDYRALAEAAFAKARQLQPDLGELHLYLFSHFFNVNHDLEQAKVELDLARRTLPNSSSLEIHTARLARLQGRWDEALECYQRAITLDPRDAALYGELYTTYGYLRRYDDYERTINAMIALLPPDRVPELPLSRAMGPLAAQADLAPLRKALSDLPDAWDPDRLLHDGYGLVLALFDHDSRAVDLLVAARKQPQMRGSDFTYPNSWFTALAARIRGDTEAAKTAFTDARADVEKTIRDDPLNERNLLLLAMIDAGLGRKDDAVKEARRACEMPCENNIMINWPSNRACLAVVYAWIGQSDEAIKELENLATQPAGENEPNQVTYGDLKLNPIWDPLRNDPRFDAVVQRLAPENSRH